MKAEDGDCATLARSQLALLYRLGLLQQDAGEVENDPHAFLNRLPPAASSSVAAANEADQLQTSGEGWKRASARSPYAPVAPVEDEPALRIKTRALAGSTTAMAAATDRVPLSPLLIKSSRGRASRFSLASSTREAPSPRELKQRWFAVWKQRLQRNAVVATADSMARRSAMRRAIRTWQSAVYARRLAMARGRQLQFWRVKRALRVWAVYASLHGRVTWFLTAQGRGFALINRLRRERAFVRWKTFLQWSTRQHKLRARATAFCHRRLLRQWWLAWCVFAFQARRVRIVYRVFFNTIRSQQVLRQSRWEAACALYASHANDRVGRLLRRWRRFNDARQRDHLRSWQVRMVVRRGRYFSIWHAVLCQERQIQALRARVRRRVKRDHARAWRAAARAVALGRSSTLWHPEAIRARYLAVWTRWARDAIRFRYATAQVHARRQRRALRVMRAWTVEHTRQSRKKRIADAVARRRILLYVWENGWMVFHSKRQLEKIRSRDIVLMAQARVLGLWRLAWAVRQEWREKKTLARRMGLRAALEAVWGAWRHHTQRRRLHKQQLHKGGRHHRHRLVITGLAALSRIVDRKSAHTTAARRIRVGQRTALTRRAFHAWRRHVQRVNSLHARLSHFVCRSAHARSVWNPLRRAWLRWERFAHVRARLRDMASDRNTRFQRMVFGGWRRRAFVGVLQRARRVDIKARRRRQVFSEWKRRTMEWRCKSDTLARAQMLFQRRQGSKALRGWHGLACGQRRRLRWLSEQVKSKHEEESARRALNRWRTKLMQRQRILSLEARRHHAWLAFCWSGWYHYHQQKTKTKRKLRYFQQTFGLYPATSLVQQFWGRWKSQTVLGVSASYLRQRRELRAVRTSFSVWKTLRLAALALRSWHTFSVTASATNSDRGKRIRLFRQRCQLRLARRVLCKWRRQIHSRQLHEERHVLNRQRIVYEIHRASDNRQKRRRCHLRMWFRRWRRRQLVELHTAVSWHRRRLCSRVIREWWRQVIHRKQERLLQDARQTMEMMTAHTAPRRPQRGYASAAITRSSTARRQTKPTAETASRSNRLASTATRPRVGTSRMIDPDMYAATAIRFERESPSPTSTVRSQQAHPREVPSSPHETQHQRRAEPVSRLHRPPQPATRPEVRTSRLNPPPEVQELPLFDEDHVAMDHRYQDRRNTDTQPAPVEVAQAHAKANSEDHVDPLMSLESLASMDPYSPVKQPSHRPLLNSSSARVSPQTQSFPPQRQPRERPSPVPQDQPRPVQPTLYTPSQSLRPLEVAPAASVRLPASQAPEKRSGAHQELADLLEIPKETQSGQTSAFRAVLHDMKAGSDGPDLDVDGVVKAIIEHYVSMCRHCASQEDTHSRASSTASGFCMLRDLGLFSNECYLAALEQAIQRSCSGEHDFQRIMKGSLTEFIARHPNYVSWTTSAEEKRLDPLGWLVTCSLTRRLGRAALSTFNDRPGRTFWVRHELSMEVVASLPKLIKCIKKYQKPLEHFFAWRPANSAPSSTSRKLMDQATFLLLMKHCNVYPQLFDRREIEHAMECAGSRRHHGESTTSFEVQLDFPQFVEALLRCSLRLKWIEEPSERGGQSSPGSDLVVVVKFLMLIFAMEGRGSMLTKRSQDLDVVMRFLQRQQDTGANAAKLRRFQGLLRTESTSAGTKRTKATSAFRTALTDPVDQLQLSENPPRGRGAGIEQYSSRTVPYTTRNVKNGDDEEKEAYTQQTQQEASRDLSKELQSRVRAKVQLDGENDVGMCTDANQVLQASRDRELSHVKETLEQVSGHGTAQMRSVQSVEANVPSTLEAENPQQRRVSGVVAWSAPPSDTDTKQADDNGKGERKFDRAASSTQIGVGSNHGLLVPMDRDAFLNEILSSIHDVELLLHQSDVRRPCTNPATSDAVERDVELTSEPFSAAYPERYAVLVNGQLPLDFDASSEGEECMGQSTDAIRVRDPLLDSLTFADRFSESRDWQSHQSIADLAAHGLHAAFPSAMYVRSPLETGELDDLTDPQRTVAYLRAETEEDELTFDELIRFG